MRGRIAAIGFVLGGAVAVAGIAACLDGRDLDFDPDASDFEYDVPEDALPPLPLLDILFVVDNSGSMAEEQTSLQEAIPEFLIDIFMTAEARGLSVDVNLGVTSTDMGTMGLVVTTCSRADYGDNGCLLHAPSADVEGCDDSYGPYLSRSTGDATYTINDLAADFRCIATLGTRGCGFEQQMKAARAAVIDNAAGCNAGFLRDRSIVVVVFVTDEDDSSVQPGHPEMFDQNRDDLGHLNVRTFLHPEFLETVDSVAEALWSLHDSGHEVLIGVLAGVPASSACVGFGNEIDGCLALGDMQRIVNAAGNGLIPSCNAEPMGVAYPPVRLVQLAQRFGERAYVDSICQPDFKGILTQLAQKSVAFVPDP